MRVLALDQSTKSGWAFGIERSDDRWLFGSFKMPKRDDNGERLVIFRNTLVDLIKDLKPDLIAYEEPYFPLQGFTPAKTEGKERMPFNPVTIKFLLNLQGVLTEATAAHAIPTTSFTSSAWRVTALGFGRAKGITPPQLKKMMIARAKALGYAVKDDNEADAIGILMHMLMGKPASERAQGDLLEHARVRL